MKKNKKTLIVNIGSSSKKYAIYFDDELKETKQVKLNENPNLGDYFFDYIGLRIVAPGKYFTENRVIDYKYIEKLSEVKESVPLHVEPVLEEIENLKERFPNSKMIGISDSGFHKDIKEPFRIYGIPKSDTEKAEIYRFGYHGISVKSVLKKFKSTEGSIPDKVLVCHLGSGASVTAVKNGKSFNTSMGFTPLEGLTMGTRVGNIDSGALIYLSKTKKMGFEDLEDYLNKKSGLLGLSGINEIKEIIKRKEEEKSKLALDIFSNDIKEYIGSYIALMNGLDLLIFTGTVGHRSDVIREKICNEMDYLGIKLDLEKNKTFVEIPGRPDREGIISNENSTVKIMVLKTDEIEEMFSQLKEFV